MNQKANNQQEQQQQLKKFQGLWPMAANKNLFKENLKKIWVFFQRVIDLSAKNV